MSSVKWTGLGHIFKDPKMQILTRFFCCFCTKNVKMKINHPKTFIYHQLLWLKTKIIKPKRFEKLAPFFYFFLNKCMDRPRTLLQKNIFLANIKKIFCKCMDRPGTHYKKNFSCNYKKMHFLATMKKISSQL